MIVTVDGHRLEAPLLTESTLEACSTRFGPSTSTTA